MRPVVIVIDPPVVDPLPGVGHRSEPCGIEALLPDAAVESLDIGVIAGFPWAREVQLDLVEISPLVKQSAGELGAIIDANTPRLPPEPDDPVELLHDLVRPKICPRRCRESLSRMAIHNRQNPERLVVKELVRHKVHRPDIVHRTGLCARRSVAARAPPPQAAGTGRQAFFAVEPVDAIMVHRPPFPPLQDMEPAIALANPALGQILQPQPQLQCRVTPRPVAVGRTPKAIASHARRSDIAKTS